MNTTLYALLAVFSWSTAATAFKLALNQVHPILLVFLSSLFSSIILFIILLIIRRGKIFKGINPKNMLKSMEIGILNPFIYYSVLFYAYRQTMAQEALILNYTWGIFLVIFSIIFLKQKIKPLSLISLFISFFGIVIIATKGNLLHFTISFSKGNILVLSSAIIWATYWIINIKNSEDPIISLFFQFLTGSIFAFIACILLQYIDFNLNLTTILYSAYIGAFEMSIPFVLWFIALKNTTNTAKVANLIYLSPFFSLFFISAILGETIHSSSFIALIFIVIGLILQQYSDILYKNIV